MDDLGVPLFLETPIWTSTIFWGSTSQILLGKKKGDGNPQILFFRACFETTENVIFKQLPKKNIPHQKKHHLDLVIISFHQNNLDIKT